MKREKFEKRLAKMFHKEFNLPKNCLIQSCTIRADVDSNPQVDISFNIIDKNEKK